MATVQEMRDAYLDSKTGSIAYLQSRIADAVESPIEELLVWGLLSIHDLEFYRALTFPSHVVLGGDPEVDAVFITSLGRGSAPSCVLQPAVRVGESRYRIDVALRLDAAAVDARVWLAIECDGHEFHEKTKEQAERDKRRDRDLQSIGWTVARLTGAEIFRDPYAAAESVYRLAQSVLDLRVKALQAALSKPTTKE